MKRTRSVIYSLVILVCVVVLIAIAAGACQPVDANGDPIDPNQPPLRATPQVWTDAQRGTVCYIYEPSGSTVVAMDCIER